MRMPNCNSIIEEKTIGFRLIIRIKNGRIDFVLYRFNNSRDPHLRRMSKTPVASGFYFGGE